MYIAESGQWGNLYSNKTACKFFFIHITITISLYLTLNYNVGVHFIMIKDFIAPVNFKHTFIEFIFFIKLIK